MIAPQARSRVLPTGCGMQDWDDFRVFLAISRGGSLNAAARELGFTQPTVSRRLTDLEKRLQVALVRRSQGGLALTEAGELLHRRALAMEEMVNSAGRQLLRHDESFSGVVRISATEGLGSIWLTRRLARLSEAYPKITVEMRLENNVADLMKREADIAVRLARPIAPDLIGRLVGVLGYGLYASAGYLARHGTPSEFGDLHRHRLATFTWDGVSGGERWRNLVALNPGVAYRSNSWFGLVQAVRAGYGVGILPLFVGEEYPDLVPVLPQEEWPLRDVWLLAHPEVRANARIRIVFDEIAAQFLLDRRIRRQSERAERPVPDLDSVREEG